MERIFIEEWNCVGRTEQVDHVGAWFTADAAGEPIVVTHAEDGQIRAMSSVCRHRYMAIASGQGTSRRLQCPYHRWSYALDGTLKGTPLMETPSAADGSTCRLPSFSVETWLGFVFVSLASNPEPLAPQLDGAGGIPPRWASSRSDRRHVAVERREVHRSHRSLELFSPRHQLRI